MKNKRDASLSSSVDKAFDHAFRPGHGHESNAGYEFRITDPTWKIAKNITLHVGNACHGLSETTEKGLRATLADMAQNKSAYHVSNLLTRFAHMRTTDRGGEITVEMIVDYRSRLDRTREWYLGSIRVLLLRWYELGYPGVGKDIYDLLNTMTLRGNIKGDAVQRRDPEQGPLTDNELLAFNEGAARAFERGDLSLQALAQALLISHTGRRPIQIAHLKLADVLSEKPLGTGEATTCLLNIPRAKQWAGTFRSSFKAFALTPELATVVRAQCRASYKAVKRIVHFDIGDADRRQLPLFPDLKAFETVTSRDSLRELLDSDRLHVTTPDIVKALKEVANTSGCHSERTGDVLNVVSRRFRYTTGTRAAREGVGILVIAELLDQTDIQNAGVYIKNIPEHMAALDAAIGHQLAPLAQAFQGNVVGRESDAVRGDDPTSRIRYNGMDTATCGKYGSCGAYIPIPCYTCIYFQPWLDGPHEQVYEHLLAERQRQLEVTGDPAVAAINDRSILAVAEVIQRCKAARREMADVDGLAVREI